MKILSSLILIVALYINCSSKKPVNDAKEIQHIETKSQLLLNKDFYASYNITDSVFFNKLKYFGSLEDTIDKNSSMIRLLIIDLGGFNFDALVTIKKNQNDSLFTLVYKDINAVHNVKRNHPTTTMSRVLLNDVTTSSPFDSLIIYLNQADFWNLKQIEKSNNGNFCFYLESYNNNRYNIIFRKSAVNMDNFYRCLYYLLQNNINGIYDNLYSN